MPPKQANEKRGKEDETSEPQSLAYFARRSLHSPSVSQTLTRQGGSQKNARETISEADVELVVDEGLEWRRYHVMKTNEHRQRFTVKCRQCGCLQSVISPKGTGISKGVGDRLIRKPGDPKGRWTMFELKRPVGWKWSSDEQREIHEQGGSYLIHSWEDMQEALAAMEEER